MIDKVKIVDPVDITDWDKQILNWPPDYSFLHTSCWAKAMVDTYNYEPCYFTVSKYWITKGHYSSNGC